MGSFSIWHWLVVLIILPAVYVPTIFYILAIRRAFIAIDEDIRPINPNMTWLELIPIFNLIWTFFLVTYLRQGYQKMWTSGRLSKETTAGYGFGLAFAICSVCGLIPGLNLLVLIPLVVFWILHWIQVHNATKLVLEFSKISS
jgi:hypothetical protein